MTELAIREENPTADLMAIVREMGENQGALAKMLAETNRPAPSALALWAEDARIAANIATSLAQTSFVPMALRGKIPEITAVLLSGQELGLPPIAALRSMDVIQGTPALRAHAMRGLVQSHGHVIQLIESDDEHCIMRGRRRGEDKWQTVTWTYQRALKLGLTGKEQWKKQPQTMLEARATGTTSRLIASDVLFAMPYTSEELGDTDGLTMPNGQPFPKPRITAADIVGLTQAAGPQDAGLPNLPALDPATSCGFCLHPGHHEDMCPQREDGSSVTEGEYEFPEDGA